MTETVKFLGKDYEVPEAAREFIEYEAALAPLISELIEASLSVLDKNRQSGPDSWMQNIESDVWTFHAHMRSVANKVAKMLVEHGIYDISADDLIARTTSLSDVEKLAGLAGTKVVQRCREIVDAQQAGVRTAYDSATAEISGSGFTVFSNSIATLAAFTIAECSVLMSQAKEADKQYERAVRDLYQRATSAIDRVCNEELVEEYYPGLNLLLIDFGDQMTNAFLVEMTEHGKFDFDSVRNYNGRKAETMLSNISSAPDEAELIRQAFEKCPFNLRVYETCLERGLMDPDTFKTAQHFHLENDLLPKIKLQCRRNVLKEPTYENAVTLYAAAFGLDRSTAVSDLLSTEAKAFVDRYQAMDSAAIDIEHMAMWFGSNIERKATIVYEWDEKLAKEKIQSALDIELDGRFCERISNEGLSETLAVPSTSSVNEVKEKAANTAYKLAVAIKQPVEAGKELLDEMEKTIERQRDRIDALRNDMEEHVDSLLKQRKSLGLFAFSAKREIDARVEETRNSFDAFEVACAIKDMEHALAVKKADINDYRMLIDGSSNINNLPDIFTREIPSPRFA